jgi:hypothetical protein
MIRDEALSVYTNLVAMLEEKSTKDLQDEASCSSNRSTRYQAVDPSLKSVTSALRKACVCCPSPHLRGANQVAQTVCLKARNI